MVEDGIDAPRRAAGVSETSIELSFGRMGELALPTFAAAFLAIVVAPQVHGVERLAAVAAALAVAGAAALSFVRTRQAARRIQRAEQAISAAVDSLDSATRVTRSVLSTLEQDVVPALDKMISATGAMATDRRMSASVRSRLATIRAAGENVEAILKGVVGAPPCKPAEPRPVPVEVAPVADLPRFSATASDEPADDFEIEAGPVALTEVGGAENPMRALVAEANPVHQLMLRTVLAQIGMEAEFVADRVELIEAWRREDWDLILLDAQSPEIDAAAAARTIRSVEVKFHWKGTPIVAMANQPSSRDVDGYAQAGIDVWVSKPIVGSSLFEAIEVAMAAPNAASAWEPVDLAEVA